MGMTDWIVVVDDDAVSLRIARNLLSEENMRVSAVHSGRELLTFMEKNRPDLILLDVLMPEMNGFETYRHLRLYEEKMKCRPTPVIFLTGEDDSDVERRSLVLGGSDFIRKPFDKDILMQRIKNVITSTRTIDNLTEEAATDPLTGLLNKTTGTQRLTRLCKTETGAMMMIDLDSFKLVNDLYGHDIGDHILKAFADIMRHNTRSEDVLCRVGGDEFIVFYKGVTDEQSVALLAGRLNEEILEAAARLMGEDHDIPLGVSVGCVLIPKQGADYDRLFPLADKALYEVKQNGKHGYAIFDPDLHPDETGEESLRKELFRMTKVMEEREDPDNAMWVGQEAFTWVYRYIMRFSKRHKLSVTKLMFGLSEIEDAGDDCDDLMVAAVEFREMVQTLLRKSDILIQSRPNRFFLLLPELAKEDIPVVVGRIMDEWEKIPHKGIEITYVCEEISSKEDEE